MTDDSPCGAHALVPNEEGFEFNARAQIVGPIAGRAFLVAERVSARIAPHIIWERALFAVDLETLAVQRVSRGNDVTGRLAVADGRLFYQESGGGFMSAGGAEQNSFEPPDMAEGSGPRC